MAHMQRIRGRIKADIERRPAVVNQIRDLLLVGLLRQKPSGF